jgi:hypothetical protein
MKRFLQAWPRPADGFWLASIAADWLAGTLLHPLMNGSSVPKSQTSFLG